MKAKSTVVSKDQTGIQDLKQKINALTTVVKSSTLGGAQPKQNNNGTTPQKMKDNGKSNGSSYKGQGLVTTSAGPFKPGQKPFQCYHCGGWGHSYKLCPSQRGIDWRALNGAKAPPSPNKGSQSRKEAINVEGGTQGVRGWGILNIIIQILSTG